MAYNSNGDMTGMLGAAGVDNDFEGGEVDGGSYEDDGTANSGRFLLTHHESASIMRGGIHMQGHEGGMGGVVDGVATLGRRCGGSGSAGGTLRHGGGGSRNGTLMTASVHRKKRTIASPAELWLV